MTLASFKHSARSPTKRLAISTLAIAVVVFVAIGIAVELVFLPSASSSGASKTTTTSSQIFCSPQYGGCPTPSTTVKTSVDQWVSDFNTRNVAGLANFYSTAAAVTWSGNAAGLAGTYNGQGNIRILYGSSIGKTLILNASIANYAESVANPSNINVTMTVLMNGNSSVVGELTSTVAATQMWNYNGQQWQIIKENWNYKTFNVQYPVSATTFPQWGALRVGQNPNLVSEKSFEWNAGPYVAASVYAFLFGVLAIGFMKYRGRSRTD
jgi:hypothetical protein